MLCDFKALWVIWDSKMQAYVFISSMSSYLDCLWHNLCGFPCVCFLGLDSCIIASESCVLWLGCILLFKLFLLCVICGLTMMVIGIDVGAHNK